MYKMSSIIMYRKIFIKNFKMKFWIFILILGLSSKCSCDSFQRKLITNQASDISTDWKPLSIKDLHPPPPSSYHQSFISLSNLPNRNKLQLAQLAAHHNTQLLRQYQNHHHHHPHPHPPGAVFASQRNHFPSSASVYNNAPVSHLSINIPTRFNHVNIQPQHIFPSGNAGNGIMTPAGPNVMKTPLPKALIKPESFSLKAQFYKINKHLQAPPSGSKTLMFNGLVHSTTAKIPTHHIRSPPYFKGFNQYSIGDPTLMGGGSLSTSASNYGPTSPKAIAAHQNILNHPMVSALKKFPPTNSPPSSFISYGYPLVAKTTNHFQMFHQAPPVTTTRTQITPPENHRQKPQQQYFKPQDDNINFKVEANLNSVYGVPATDVPFMPAHHNRQHQIQEQNIKALPNLAPQLLPPVPASVLTPFFVPLQDQDFLNTNKSSKGSETKLFEPNNNDELINRRESVNNSSNSLMPLYEKSEKSKEQITTVRNIDKSEILKLENDPITTTPTFISSANEFSNDGFNPIFSTKTTVIAEKPVNNYLEDSNNNNFKFSPPQRPLEKFESVFNNQKSTSSNFLPTPQVHGNFFTLEDAITIRPFKEFDGYEEIIKIPKTPIREKPLNLNGPNQITSTETIRQNHMAQQPIRYRPKNRTEPIPTTSSTTSTTSSTTTTTTTVPTFTRNEAINIGQRNQNEKRYNYQHIKNFNRIEQSSSEKPTTASDSKSMMRKKPTFKNSKRYQNRTRNNTMEGIRVTSTVATIKHHSIMQLPAVSSTATTTTSSTNNNRPTPLLMISKTPYSRVPPSLRPVLRKENPLFPTQISNQNTGDGESFVESTQVSTIPATAPGISYVPTTLNSNFDVQGTLAPTVNNVGLKLPEQVSTHYPIISSTMFQSISSSSSSVPETTKRRHRLKNRKPENELTPISHNELPSQQNNNNRSNHLDSEKPIPSPTPNQTRETIKNATESVVRNTPSERPKFSIRNYHRQRPHKNVTSSSSAAPSITTNTTTTTTTTTPEISPSSAERNTTAPSFTTRRRLAPSLQFRNQHNVTENSRKRGQTMETLRNREKNSGESSENNSRPTRRRGSDVRRNPYSHRNGNTSSREVVSKEVDSSMESPSPPTLSDITTKDKTPLVKNTTSLLRRPQRISLKERIQNHMNRKTLNGTSQSTNNSDDLLNITLDTKSSSVEPTTPPSSSTMKIESAIMKIAKDDHYSSHSQRINIITSTSSPLSFSSTSSSSSSSSSSKLNLRKSSTLIQKPDMSDISRYVDELTASSSSNSLTLLNRGLHTRRIPNYFTIATEDPILPIEAFFPNVLKDNNNNNDSINGKEDMS